MNKKAWFLIVFITGATGRCWEAEAAPAESDCVAREGIFAAADVPCKTAPFASFSGRTEKGGPARPERVPIFSSVVKEIKKGKHNAEIFRNCSDATISCAVGFADTTSFSLLDAKRTKQEKHAWGSIPHVPRARHFGSGQLNGTLEHVRRKGFKLTASRRFRQEAFSFPRCARKFPHEPRKR